MWRNPLSRAFLAVVLAAALALLVAALALFVVACGGSGKATTSASAGAAQPGGAITAPASTQVGKSGDIVVSGLVDFPMTFTALDMDYMDWTTVTADDPQLGSTAVEGVRLSDILSYVGVQPQARTVIITASDGFAVEVTLVDLSTDALLTVSDDNNLGTVMPGMAGEAWVKDVVAMEFK